MNKLNKIAKCKQWIIRIATTRFLFQNSKQSIDWKIWRYKIKRREPIQNEQKRGKYQDAAVICYRRSKLKGYEYIQINICHYLRFNIDFHRPL